MNWELFFKLAISVLGLGTGVIVLLAKLKEAKAKKKDPTWKPNPIRCQEERDRLTGLEGQNKVWLQRFDSVDSSLADLKAGQKTLLDLHLKP